MSEAWLDDVRWDEHGLVPVIAQEASSGDVLMFAWMNREALARTAELGEAVYWSRSRVEQVGGIACHTGRHSCFFQRRMTDGRWEAVEPVIKSPKDIYK